MLRRLFLKSILPTLVMCNAYAQIPVNQSTVTHATASLDKPTVKAGDTVQVALRFNAPFPRNTVVEVGFKLTNPTFGFSNNITILQNQQEGTIPIKVDVQADAGDYVLSSAMLLSEKRQPVIKVNPALVLHVIAQPDTAALPTEVTATIDLTKRQYILSQAATLEGVRNKLATQVDGRAALTSALLQNLVDACQNADAIVLDSQTMYLKGWNGDARLKPVFFDDFHQRFLAYLVELKQQQATTRRSALTPILTPPQVIWVQLVQRKSNDKAVQDWKAPMLSGTYPLAAQAVLDLIGETISAFRRVSDTGVDTFVVSLKSSPPGASISFMRVGTDFQAWPVKTDTKVEFPLAKYTFRFTMDGCEHQDVPLDPYLMADAELNPEFKSCKK